MDVKEEALIRSLIDTDQILRTHYEEHGRLKNRLQELREKDFLSSSEEVEEKTIQKQKLSAKDRIMEILARYKQQAA